MSFIHAMSIRVICGQRSAMADTDVMDMSATAIDGLTSSIYPTSQTRIKNLEGQLIRKQVY